MQKALIVLILIVAIAAGWFFLNPAQQANSPAGSQTTVPTEIQQQAQTHISQLTDGQNSAIDIQSADNFVTAEQLLALPEQAQAEAAISSTEEGHNNTDNGTFAVDPNRLNVLSKGNNSTISVSTDTTLPLAQQIKLNELLNNPDQNGEQVYFIHAVNQGDDKGLWGIIQNGLTRTFTAGLVLPGDSEKVFAEIPEEADEKLANQQSSFLGKVLQSKVKETYIYNFRQGILGENPDLIKPGQQLVIVTFSKQELIGIYNHFVNR